MREQVYFRFQTLLVYIVWCILYVYLDQMFVEKMNQNEETVGFPQCRDVVSWFCLVLFSR